MNNSISNHPPSGFMIVIVMETFFLYRTVRLPKVIFRKRTLLLSRDRF
jgi:hypothetical protein